MIEWPRSETTRKGRGGRRPGAGRKPNHLKQLALQPIGGAEIVARRHPQSERLSPEELAMLHALTKKLAEPSPDGLEIKRIKQRGFRSVRGYDRLVSGIDLALSFRVRAFDGY
jgi:hypothetical protein